MFHAYLLAPTLTQMMSIPKNTLPLEEPWADGVWPAVKASAYDPLEREPGTDREGDGGVRHLQVERLCAVGPLRLAEEENA
jgi:hypothetical protein